MTGELQSRTRRVRIEHDPSCRCKTCRLRRRREDRFVRLVCLDCPARITGKDGIRCQSCAATNADRTARYKHPERFPRPATAPIEGRITVYRCGYCEEYGHNRAKCPQRHEEALQAARRLGEAA